MAPTHRMVLVAALALLPACARMSTPAPIPCVTIADHHTESERFLVHVAREESVGRRCPAEWSWIVPPVSGGLTPVFHRYYDPPQPGLRPAYVSRGAPGPGVDGQRSSSGLRQL